MKLGPSLLCVLLLSLTSTSLAVTKDVTKLQIGVKHKPATCTRRAKAGDSVSVHYTVRYLVAMQQSLSIAAAALRKQWCRAA